MVVSKIIGGLGNQMFQYAAGRSLALEFGMEFRIDISGFRTYELWNYELDKLNIHAKTADEDTLKNEFERYVDDNLGYHELNFKQEMNIYLDGYFQYERYFKKHEDVIRDDFKLIAKISRNGETWKSLINNSTCPVSLVTRRGDYLLDTDYFGVCSSGYYNYCISEIVKKYEDCQFFVFADDINWAKDNLKFLGKHYYVNDVISSPEKIMLISCCKHHILANSTFAWWGGWLSKYEYKEVYVPSPWFDGSTLDSTLDKWVKVNKYF